MKKRKIKENFVCQRRYNFLKYQKEKDNELKKLLEKLNFHILMEIILFSEAQMLEISVGGTREKEGIIFFCDKNNIVLVTLENDKESSKKTLCIDLNYIKRIFGYFKNDKFRKHFQIIRSFEFKIESSPENIVISKLIPSKKVVNALIIKRSINTFSTFIPNTINTLTLFDQKINKKLKIKKIKFENFTLSDVKDDVNKILEKVKCEEFIYDNNFGVAATEKFKLTTGLKHLKGLLVDNYTMISFLDEKKFNYSESFLHLKKIVLNHVNISNVYLEFMLMNLKKLKIFRIISCPIDLFNLLKFIKGSKIKDFFCQNTEYEDVNKFKDIKENQNIADNLKNTTLEDLIIDDGIDVNFIWLSILHLIFKNLKSFTIIHYRNQIQNEEEAAIYLSQIGLEKIHFRLFDESKFLTKFLENTDKKKLNKIEINFTGRSVKNFYKKIAKIIPKLTSLKITHPIREDIDNIPQFLEFLKKCNIREFTFYIYSSYGIEKKAENIIEMFFNCFNENQYMQFMSIRMKNNYHEFRKKR